MAAKPDSKAGADGAESGKNKGGKGLMIGLIAVVLLAGGGGAGWYLTRPAAHGNDEQAEAKVVAEETSFLNLEPFTVNLADPGGERLAQIGIVLEMSGKTAQERLNKHLPVVRNSLLLLISSQSTKQLLTLEGKLALADEIALRTGTALGWQPEDDEPDEAEQDNAEQARKVGNRRSKNRRVRRPHVPNPVVAVHFSQMLVQ